LAIFGFELLCEAGMEEERFHQLMERFAQVSLRITTAWSQVPGLHGFILHDDLTMTSGPLFAPSWYREHIFCHYPAIFAPLRRAGVPIIFTSDGNCTAFVDDIFASGADGLNFEYLVDLETLIARHGDKILIGNINSAVISQGSEEQITNVTRQCIAIGAKAPRFVVNLGGGITHDMSPAAIDSYLKVRNGLCRTARNGRS
jgi:uroporphyrinogen-III decarboxylase